MGTKSNLEGLAIASPLSCGDKNGKRQI
jgi:hypothetical protein